MDRGIAIVEQAIDLNPHPPGWVHYILSIDHYRKREFEQALLQAKRANLPQFAWTPLCVAVAAGQLGLVADVRAAIDVIRKQHPAYLDPDKVRALWSMWQWDSALVDRLLDGFVKALSIADRPAVPARPSSALAIAQSPASDRMASIAVMPFSDLSPAKDQEWFCDGIAEEILNALTPLKNLRVAARASAFSLRGRSDDLRIIGEKLNVTTVLGGSVRRAGDRVRITVQLSEVQTGFQIWSERYDRELKDIFDIQDDIAKAVAERLKVALADSPLDRLARLVEHGTTNVEAYQLYLQGRALLNRRGTSIPVALDLFERAVNLDPDYAVAWAGIADAHTVLAYYGGEPPAESKPLALAAAKRALALDPSSAAAHAALGAAALVYENDRDLAGAEFVRALELNPHDTHARCWYALFYLQWVCGDAERGVAEARRAFDIDPLSSYVTMILSMCLTTAGEISEALELGRLAIEQDPESFVARWALGGTLIEARRLEEAVATLEQAARMSNRHPNAVASLATVHGLLGKPDVAAAHLRELAERAQRSYVPFAPLIPTAFAAGQRDVAMDYAERSWAAREPAFILLARHAPEWRALRVEPRFQAILRDMDAR